MIPTLLRIALTTLRRDRVVQAMTFLLPVIFFSIFAMIFGSQGGDVTSRVQVAVVDEDHSEASARLFAALLREPGLRIRTRARRPGEPADTTRTLVSRMRALELVKSGDVPVAIVIPPGFGATFGGFGDSVPQVELLSDRADPVAPQVVSGLRTARQQQYAQETWARITNYEMLARDLDLIQQEMGDWKAGEPSSWHPAINGHKGPALKVQYKNTEQAHITLAVLGVSNQHPDRYAIDLLSAIIGEGMSSRLFMELREQRSLC